MGGGNVFTDKDLIHLLQPENFAFFRQQPPKFLIVLILLCLTYSSPSFGGPTLTYPDEINFNYTQGGDIDAINIRKNYTTDITIPEYKYYVRNEPCAYIRGGDEDDNNIRVSFYSACQTVNLSIDVTVISGTGIGEIHE